MRIAYIGLRGVPANYSGIEKAVEEIGGRLSNKHEITVYCMASRYKERPPFYKGMALKYIPNIPGKNFEMISYAFLSTLRACFSKADVIHFHAIGPTSFAILARLFGKKVVSTNHGLDWRRSKWGKLAETYLKFGEYVSAKFTHRTISVSKYIQKYYIQKYLTEVVYIPNGKDKNIEPNLKALEKYKIETDHYILFVGRVTQEKGIQYLCRAFNESTFDRGMKLVIVGGAIDTFKVELETEFQSNSKIIFTGPLYDRNELAGLYSNASLFVLPSEIEGQSIVILEALSYGCSVLASDIPENMDLLDKYGNFFRVGSLYDLKENLIEALNNHRLKIVNKTDLEVFLEKHDWNRIAIETEQVYFGVIN
jgi:glycosyltransferase involved in cell wall biosynthesis